jgi:hypothetical protein
VNCDSCNKELSLVDPSSGDNQYDNALEIEFGGGYGMFVDPLPGKEYKALICHDCAVFLCQAIPFIEKIIDPAHSHTHRDEDEPCLYS